MNLLLAAVLLATVPAGAETVELKAVEVGVRDLPAAAAWFEKDLGLAPQSVSASRAVFVSGAARVVLAAAAADGAATLSLVSADADADYARLVKLGAAPVEAPADRPSGFREATVRGPGGLNVRFEGPLAAPADFALETMTAGDGPAPGPADTVRVRYTGRTRDGTVFDGPHERAILVPLSAAIPCWKKALPMMRVGGRARFRCPPALGYGAEPHGRRVPPDSELDFDVELLGVSR